MDVRRHRQVRRRFRAAALAAAVGGAAATAPHAAAAQVESSGRDLVGLSLEQLMEIEVTSVSKRPERLGDAAAAVSVLTREDIRRSGATNLPDLLRQVPGLAVAQSDATHWAVGSRGFNDIYATKLLVMIDGRPIYSPAFSGVFWDAQAQPLTTIERIEVIRGPGGVLWGANAVNGVINIITRSPAEAQRAHMWGDLDSEGGRELGLSGAGRLGANLTYAANVAARANDGVLNAAGENDGERVEHFRIGGGVEWTPSPVDKVSLKVSAFTQETRSLMDPPLPNPRPEAESFEENDRGGNVTLEWRRSLSDRSDFTLRAFYDNFHFEDYTNTTHHDTYDIEARHRLAWGAHDLVWGGGYRHIDYRAPRHPVIELDRTAVDIDIANVFAQDQITLSPTLNVVVGGKLEHNSFTGLEYSATLRGSWTPRPGHTVWAALSRASRTPSVVEKFITLRLGVASLDPFVLTQVVGNRDQQSEILTATEVGYRFSAPAGFSLDVAAYYNDYDNLGSLTPTPLSPVEAPLPLPFPIYETSLQVGNDLEGRAYGGEVAATWQAAAWWRLSADYSLQVMDVRPRALAALNNDPGNSPRHQAQLRSRMDLTDRLELDVGLKHVSRLKTADIPAYTRLDARLSWRITPTTEVGVVGQNLLEARHAEYSPAYFRARSEIPRTMRVFVRAGF